MTQSSRPGDAGGHVLAKRFLAGTTSCLVAWGLPLQSTAEPQPHVAPPATTAAPSCPLGQVQSIDTAGHCCWPGQAFSRQTGRCAGAPRCPAGSNPYEETCLCADATCGCMTGFVRPFPSAACGCTEPRVGEGDRCVCPAGLVDANDRCYPSSRSAQCNLIGRYGACGLLVGESTLDDVVGVFGRDACLESVMGAPSYQTLTYRRPGESLAEFEQFCQPSSVPQHPDSVFSRTRTRLGNTARYLDVRPTAFSFNATGTLTSIAVDLVATGWETVCGLKKGASRSAVRACMGEEPASRIPTEPAGPPSDDYRVWPDKSAAPHDMRFSFSENGLQGVEVSHYVE